MRTQCVLAGCFIAALTGCGRHDGGASKTAGTTPGVRRAGLWRQTVVRDGRSTPLGPMRVCIDAATDAKMTMIGHAVGGSRCTRSSVKAPDGSITFHSMCSFGRAGVVESSGAVQSDFSSSYRLHAVSTVHGSVYGPMNGPHVTDISASYVGPCPSGMSPGEVIIGPGLKINLDRLPLAGAAAVFG